MTRNKTKPETAALRKMDQTLLMCRYLRHAWKYLGVYERPDRKELVSVVQCRDCRTIREQRTDKKGGLRGVYYRYPEGYTLHTGGRVKAIEVRKEVLRRRDRRVKHTRAELLQQLSENLKERSEP